MKDRNSKGQFFKGRTYVMSAEHKRKIGFANKGKNHGLWKGDRVGYASLHEWVRRNFGIPTVCEKCGEKNGLEWAKKKGRSYSRARKDWIQLCRSCHKRYDKIILNIKKMR